MCGQRAAPGPWRQLSFWLAGCRPDIDLASSALIIRSVAGMAITTNFYQVHGMKTAQILSKCFLSLFYLAVVKLPQLASATVLWEKKLRA